jgi:hypothetical protein
MASPITNGAELVRQLRDQGCPESKLVVARDVLARISADEDRTATADEVIAGMEAVFSADHKTVIKAKVLAATGEWKEPVSAKTIPIEDQLLKTEEKKPEKVEKSEEKKPEEKGKK